MATSLSEFIERGMAFFSGQTVSLAELTDERTKLTQANTRIAELEAQLAQANDGRVSESNLLTSANQSIQTLTAERDALKVEVETLKAGAKTVDEAASLKAQQIVAAQGIPIVKVPESGGGAAESNEAKLNTLRAQLASEPDPIKRAAIAQQCRELRGHADIFQTNK